MDLENLPASGEELTSFLAESSDEDLAAIREALEAAMIETHGDGSGLTSEDISQLEQMRAQLDETKATQASRESEAQKRAEKAAQLMDGVGGNGPDDNEDGDGDTGEGEPDGGGDAGATDGGEESVTEAETVVATAMARMFDRVADQVVMSVGAGGRDLNQHIRLADIAKHAPDAKVPERRSEAVLTASADIHPFTQGGRINGYDELAQAMHERARSMGIEKIGAGSTRKMVASLKRDFKHQLGRQPSEEEINRVLKDATDVEALIASGGWCAPSEISYDFFSIVAEDGMIDLPSVGTAERGGIQMPTSPTFGDVIESPGIWTWTEQDDINAADSDSFFKPCVRIPCPDFKDVRLLCDGLCAEAGNLVEFAYPEAVRNYLRLLMAARAHLTNAKLIELMVDGGTTPDDIGPSLTVDHTGLIGDATAKTLSSIELSAIDTRNKFRMDRNAILEAAFPEWWVGPIKNDLANREGIDYLSVSNAMIANWFNSKDIRAQFVKDWQTDGAGEIGGPTPAESWPATGDYLIYAPGTFVRANGLSMNLGVIRDSELNRTNDHTAAFIEDCYLLHKPGHESRVVTVDLCTSGQVGSSNLVCAS